MRKLLFLLFIGLLQEVAGETINGSITIDGVDYSYYYTDSSGSPYWEASITKCNTTRAGELVIPNAIEVDGMKYPVSLMRNYAFQNCKLLTRVVLPRYLRSISYFAFDRCEKITSVVLPQNLTTVGPNAFNYCHPTEVTAMSQTPCNISSSSFSNQENCTLYVPIGCKSAYEAADYWKDFKEIIEIYIEPDDSEELELEMAVRYLQVKQVIDGTTLADAQPDGDLLRAQIAKMAFRGVYSTGSGQVPTVVPSDYFPTVYEDLATKTDANAYYYQAAKALLYLDYGDGVTPFDRNRLTFSPTERIARVHVLKVLMETFNIQPEQNDYVQRAAQLGIINDGGEAFRPTDNCTRGEAFLMLYRIMKAVEKESITAPAPTDADYFEPLNTTLATIGLGTGLSMGNFQHYTKTSFALSGTVPLLFSHTYNSYSTTLPEVFYGARAADVTGDTYRPLGDGWSHNYHSFITVVDTDNGLRAIVHWGGGHIDVYKSDGPKIVPVSLGVYDDFTLDGNDAVIKSKNQMTFRFSRQGSTGAAVLYLSSITDRNGNTLTLNYEQGENGAKRISDVTDGHRSLTFSYKQGTNLVESVSDPLGRTIGFSYTLNKATGHYQLSSFTDAKGQKTTYTYGDGSRASTSKLLTRIQLPKGNYIENQYDANCRLAKSESGVNDVPKTETSVSVAAKYGLGTASTQSAVSIKRDNKTSVYNYTYNGNNVTTAMTGEEGLFANITYGDAANPQLPTAASTNSTEVSDAQYDAKGNLTSITIKGDGELTTSMTYDEMNNLTSITDPNGNLTTYTYDAKGNLQEVSAPEGVTWTFAVNSKGQPTEIKNPMGVRTEYEYNEYGNLVKTTLPALSLSSTATYDAASRLLSTTDALNRTRKFAYDPNDKLTCSTDPAGHQTQYAFDSNDNLTAITNAKGGVTTLTYDNATDWLTSVSFAGATKKYDYNRDGTLSVYTKPDGTRCFYTYDKLGRITNDGTHSYSYDNKQRLQSVSQGEKSVTFNYDGFNRISKISRPYDETTYTYDNNGNRTSVGLTKYTYDGLNRLTSVNFHSKIITYTYRKDSRIDKVSYPNGMTTRYEYDAVGRLVGKHTTLKNGTVVASYTLTLDNAGNIVSQTAQEPYDMMSLSDEEVNYTYNSGNRITKAGDISFEFDANGNTTKRGSEAYTWDKFDRLTKAGDTEITYNPLGLMDAYGDTEFRYDLMGMGNVVADTKSQANYCYGLGLEARRIIRNASAHFGYYVTDLRGSVVAIVDDNGNITHKYQYDEYGRVTQKEEADYNPFQYVGKYGVIALNDHQYYMRARHYDPTIGRFLSEDPIWSTNLYPYADNNPIMGIDPRGLSTRYDNCKSYQAIHDVYDDRVERLNQLYRDKKIDWDQLARYLNKEKVLFEKAKDNFFAAESAKQKQQPTVTNNSSSSVSVTNSSGSSAPKEKIQNQTTSYRVTEDGIYATDGTRYNNTPSSSSDNVHYGIDYSNFNNNSLYGINEYIDRGLDFYESWPNEIKSYVGEEVFWMIVL